MSDQSELEKAAEEYCIQRDKNSYADPVSFKAGAEWQTSQVWNANNPLKRCDELLTCAEKERDQLKAGVERLKESRDFIIEKCNEQLDKVTRQSALLDLAVAALEKYENITWRVKNGVGDFAAKDALEKIKKARGE